MKSRTDSTSKTDVPPIADPDLLPTEETPWPALEESLLEALAAGLEGGRSPDAATRRRLATLRRPRTARFELSGDPVRHPQD